MPGGRNALLDTLKNGVGVPSWALSDNGEIRANGPRLLHELKVPSD